MIRQTGGRAVGEISTKSSPACWARSWASRVSTTPICSPPGPIRNTSGTRMRWLMRVGKPPRGFRGLNGACMAVSLFSGEGGIRPVRLLYFISTRRSASSFSLNASSGMAPWSPATRLRTETVPFSISRPPMTSMYGIFCICASRILAPIFSGRPSTCTRKSFARSFAATSSAAAVCLSVTGISTACTGASHSGNAPA